jgi:hypothetical protein
MKLLLALIPILFSTSCTKNNSSSQNILSGEYEVYETIIEMPEETLVFGDSGEKLVFTSTDVYWYYLNNNEWVNTGNVRLTYVDNILVKVGCRNVISYDQDHITWEQDDWLITRRFK